MESLQHYFLSAQALSLWLLPVSYSASLEDAVSMATIHSPDIGRRDRKGRGGGCNLEGSKTYGVGGGKL